jgi:hypothetical protein
MRWFVLAAMCMSAASYAQKPAAEPEKPPAPAAAAPAPGTAETAAPSATTEAPKTTRAMLRTVSYPVFGLGVVAAAVGAYFGGAASAARTSILADQATGTATAQMLFDRDQARIGQARAANALFITAGILAVAAIVLFVLGG